MKLGDEGRGLAFDDVMFASGAFSYALDRNKLRQSRWKDVFSARIYAEEPQSCGVI